MDFNDTKDEAKFRDEVSSWLSANADKKEHAKDIYRPAEMSGEGESGESSALKDAKAWQAKNTMLAGHVFIGLKIMVDVMQLQWKE